MNNKIIGVTTGWLLRIINATSQLILIKLIVEVYNIEVYAIFAIIAGLWGWMQIVDFGYGSALINTIINGVNQDIKIALKMYKKYITMLVIILAILSILISTIFSGYVFKSIDIISENEKTFLLGIVLFVMGLSVIGSMGYKGFTSVDKAWVGNVLQIVAAAMALAWILMIKYWELSNTINAATMIIGYWFCMMIMSVIGILYFYSQNNKKTDSSEKESDNIGKIHERAKYFFMMSLVASASVQSDVLIGSILLNKNDIAYYSYVSKVYALIYMAFTSITQVLWPHLAEILNSKDVLKYNKLLKNYLIMSAAAGIVGVVIFEYFKREIISFVFTGGEMNVTRYTFTLFGIYTVIRVVTEFFAASIGAFDKLKYSMLVISCQAIVSISCSYFATKLLGLDGLIIGALMGYLMTSFWMFPYKVYVIFR